MNVLLLKLLLPLALQEKLFVNFYDKTRTDYMS